MRCGWHSLENASINDSHLLYVYLAQTSSSRLDHFCISVVLSSFKVHMFGCVHALQNSLISPLIKLVLSSSVISFALSLLMLSIDVE